MPPSNVPITFTLRLTFFSLGIGDIGQYPSPKKPWRRIHVLLHKASVRVILVYVAGWCATFNFVALLLMIVAKSLYNPHVQEFSPRLGGMAFAFTAQLTSYPCSCTLIGPLSTRCGPSYPNSLIP
jgi:hypothetical protein